MLNFLFISLTLITGSIYAHSYISSPAARGGQFQASSGTGTGCRQPTCMGPCYSAASTAVSLGTIARGSTISMKWPRNNHPGGFIRFAWAPTASSDTMSAFDNSVQSFQCFETGTPTCTPSDPTNPNGGDTGGQFNCGGNVVVPGWVTDGAWTLQWAWFGGGYGLADYYSCLDYTISGGPAATQGPITFTGGDYANPTNTNVCKWFNTDQLHVCLTETCTTNISSTSPFNGPPNYTVKNVAPTAITSGAGTPITSNAMTPITSNAVTPITSDAVSQAGVSNDQGSPCTNNSDCSSGICQVTGYCMVSSKKGLDGGSVAAIFFALIFGLVVVAVIVFAVINKSEWSNWRVGPISKASKFVFKSGA